MIDICCHCYDNANIIAKTLSSNLFFPMKCYFVHTTSIYFCYWNDEVYLIAIPRSSTSRRLNCISRCLLSFDEVNCYIYAYTLSEFVPYI